MTSIEKWTYANLNSGEGWSNQTFETKSEAIEQAKIFKEELLKQGYDVYIVVGQVLDYLGTSYVENQEKI